MLSGWVAADCTRVECWRLRSPGRGMKVPWGGEGCEWLWDLLAGEESPRPSRSPSEGEGESLWESAGLWLWEQLELEEEGLGEL